MKMDHRVLMPIELLIIYLSTDLRVNSGIGPYGLNSELYPFIGDLEQIFKFLCVSVCFLTKKQKD